MSISYRDRLRIRSVTEIVIREIVTWGRKTTDLKHSVKICIFNIKICKYINY